MCLEDTVSSETPMSLCLLPSSHPLFCNVPRDFLGRVCFLMYPWRLGFVALRGFFAWPLGCHVGGKKKRPV